jgi:hypothetical protein
MGSGILHLLFKEILRVIRRDPVRKQNYAFVAQENYCRNSTILYQWKITNINKYFIIIK